MRINQLPLRTLFLMSLLINWFWCLDSSGYAQVGGGGPILPSVNTTSTVQKVNDVETSSFEDDGDNLYANWDFTVVNDAVARDYKYRFGIKRNSNATVWDEDWVTELGGTQLHLDSHEIEYLSGVWKDYDVQAGDNTVTISVEFKFDGVSGSQIFDLVFNRIENP